MASGYSWLKKVKTTEVRKQRTSEVGYKEMSAGMREDFLYARWKDAETATGERIIRQTSFKTQVQQHKGQKLRYHLILDEIEFEDQEVAGIRGGFTRVLAEKLEPFHVSNVDKIASPKGNRLGGHNKYNTIFVSTKTGKSADVTDKNISDLAELWTLGVEENSDEEVVTIRDVMANRAIAQHYIKYPKKASSSARGYVKAFKGLPVFTSSQIFKLIEEEVEFGKLRNIRGGDILITEIESVQFEYEGEQESIMDLQDANLFDVEMSGGVMSFSNFDRRTITTEGAKALGHVNLRLMEKIGNIGLTDEDMELFSTGIRGKQRADEESKSGLKVKKLVGGYQPLKYETPLTEAELAQQNVARK